MNKERKKPFARLAVPMLMAVLMVVAMMPIETHAATAYPLWVGGVQVTDANKDDITAAITAEGGTASGTAAYDPDSGTLTLTDFQYSGAGYEYHPNSYVALYYDSEDDLIISFSGENRLERTGSAVRSSSGMYFNSQNYENPPTVSFRGSDGDSLTVKSGASAGDNSEAIATTSVNLAFSGGEVNADAEKGYCYSYGIYVGYADLTISDGNLNAKGGTATTYDSQGVHLTRGTINVAGGTLTAAGGDGNRYSLGIEGAIQCKVSVTGGMLVAQGKSQAIKDVPLSLETGMEAKGSVTGNEADAASYIEADNDNYKWVKVEKIPEYTVTVEGGTADKTTAKAGETVTITADEPEEGMIFNQWALNDTDVSFQTTDAWKTTFTMPAEDVTVTAVFRNIIINDTPPDQVYTGEAFEPTFSFFGVQVEGAGVLWPGSNYALTYADNTDVGTAKVILTVTDNRKGSKIVTFQITPADFTTAEISEIPDQKCTGVAIEPEPTVTWNGKTLVKDEDYTLSYENNEDVGTATVIVKGKGNFEGTKTGTFRITPAPIVEYTVTFVDGLGKTLKTQKVESGKAATAPIAPKRSGYTFTGWDKDFSKVTANMTVTAKWKKNPAPVKKVSGTLLAKMTAKGSKSLVISWSKVTGADGYDVFFAMCNHHGKEIQLKKAGTIKGNKTFKWTKKSLKKKTAYKAVVKAYVMKNGKKSYVRTSPMAHAYTSGWTKNYTNPKSVTAKKTSVSLKSGKTYKIKASVKKLKNGKKLMPSGHAPKLRYLCSNKKIATVSSTGKITAKCKGSCKVYVIAVNGASKAVLVKVK